MPKHASCKIQVLHFSSFDARHHNVLQVSLEEKIKQLEREQVVWVRMEVTFFFHSSFKYLLFTVGGILFFLLSFLNI